MIDETTTSIGEEDFKGEVKTMETEKIIEVEPFNDTHASMKDIDMQNVLTKIKQT